MMGVYNENGLLYSSYKTTNQMHQISKALFYHKTVHVSGIFCAHHQELSTVHTAIGTFHASYVTAPQQSQVGTAVPT